MAETTLGIWIYMKMNAINSFTVRAKTLRTKEYIKTIPLKKNTVEFCFTTIEYYGKTSKAYDSYVTATMWTSKNLRKNVMSF